MKHALIALMSLSLSVVSISAAAADKVTTVPVHFAKGASSATLKGSFAGYDSVQYTVDARARQTMAVSTSGSANANFNVFAPGDEPGESTALASNSGTSWTGKLPENGTYIVQVYQMRASARCGEKVNYTITISIH